MANGGTHRVAAAAIIGAVCINAERGSEQKTIRPMVGAGLAATLTNLPDIIEPALNPHHRQFFHSLVFAGAVAWTGYQAYKWETETPLEEALRFVLMVGAGAYLVHLALDAGTPKSLPLIGKL